MASWIWGSCRPATASRWICCRARLSHWPEPWTLGLAAAGLLLWAGLAITLLRRRETSGRALLWGLVVLPAGVLGAAVLGLGLVLGVAAIRGAAEP
jgi:hypothetical protein